ncbi:MAG: DUF1326 domain-containing protein, partial [Geminicoccaceae bacterium]
CEAVVAMEIHEGHFGQVKLDGSRLAMVFWFPGAVHEGRGKCQRIVDQRADAAQRDALLKVMAGEDTEPFATMFFVYNSVLEEVFEPIFASIEFEANVDERRGQIFVEGLIEARAEPIKNPVTGAEHRARIDLPHGFEYEIAEVGSGSTRTGGKIVLDLKDSYAQFAHLHLSNRGVIRHRTPA